MNQQEACDKYVHVIVVLCIWNGMFGDRGMGRGGRGVYFLAVCPEVCDGVPSIVQSVHNLALVLCVEQHFTAWRGMYCYSCNVLSDVPYRSMGM